VLLSAPELGIAARVDFLETADGCVRPVDYKKGEAGPLGPWDSEVLQLCAQGMALRENGYRCDASVLYYAEVRQRVEVPFPALAFGSCFSRVLKFAC
jgi:CRISPR-associated protein Cas1